MSQPVIVKAYGSLEPVSEEFAAEIASILASACGEGEGAILNRKGSMATISFEGIYFPEDDLILFIERHVAQEMTGKLDILDMEEWRLRRYIIKNGVIERKTGSLNDVLAYSGH